MGKKNKNQSQQIISSILTKHTATGKIIALNRSFVLFKRQAHESEIRIVHIEQMNIEAGIYVHNSRIHDISMFSEDIDLVASASINGRINISSILLDNDNLDIKIDSDLTIQIEDDCLANPRVCWHCHKTHILFVAWSKRLLRFDTRKLKELKAKTKGGLHLLSCPIGNLSQGIGNIGKHAEEITDISTCSWMENLLVSASVDGKVKVWDMDKTQLLYEWDAYNGGPVGFASFSRASRDPNCTVLITRALLSLEITVWASQEDDWLSSETTPICVDKLNFSPSDGKSYKQGVFMKQSSVLLTPDVTTNDSRVIHVQEGNRGILCHVSFKKVSWKCEHVDDITGYMHDETTMKIGVLYRNPNQGVYAIFSVIPTLIEGDDTSSIPRLELASSQDVAQEMKQFLTNMKKELEEHFDAKLNEIVKKKASQIKAPLDLTYTQELSRLISGFKYEEAFKAALSRGNVDVVCWLCGQVELEKILRSMNQMVLLALLQQLNFAGTPAKFVWMNVVVAFMRPLDPKIGGKVCDMLTRIYDHLSQQCSLPGIDEAEITSIRTIMINIESVLKDCK